MFDLFSRFIILAIFSSYCIGGHKNYIAQNQDRYQILEDGNIVLDQVTHLQWMRCSVGQTRNVSTCEGKPSTFTVLDAIEYGQKFEFDGASDWRLPTYDEFVTIIYCSDGQQ